jgi:hypothetical protein
MFRPPPVAGRQPRPSKPSRSLVSSATQCVQHVKEEFAPASILRSWLHTRACPPASEQNREWKGRQIPHKQDFGKAHRIFNTATVTIGGLYLATHSVAVTVLETVAATLLCTRGMWLARRSSPALPDNGAPRARPRSRIPGQRCPRAPGQISTGAASVTRPAPD